VSIRLRGRTNLLAGVDRKDKIFEVALLVTLSAIVFAIFYGLLGSNGLVLGNDPAVHLQTAEYFLNVGRIPLSDAAWYTPLYQLVLDTFFVFTGVTSVEQKLILMKAVTALVDWLLIFSVYIVAAKFFGKKTGIFAVSLMLLCFPLYEINSWGGYTSLLSMPFMILLLMYLALPLKSIGNTILAFIFAFSLVLSHQLATFLAVFILPPFILVMLVKSKGRQSKALIATVLGGTIAFLIYYVKPILPFLGDIVSIVFFQLTAMLYQVPSVSFHAFMVDFGFVLFLAFAGLVVAFFELRKRKSLSFYLLLVLAFAVSLFFSQSYLFGLYLPYQRFVYFLLPPLAVLGAVSLSFAIDLILASYFNNKRKWRGLFLKSISIVTIFVLVVVMVLRFQTVSGKISEDVPYYSTSDVNSYQIGAWVNQHIPDASLKGIVTEKPGHWFAVYSDKTVIAETNPVIEWNLNAECVLGMSYELAHPLTMVRVYNAKSNISDENYIQEDMVWRRATYSSMDYARLTYQDENGAPHSFALSSLNRSISIDEVNYPKTITIIYSGDDFALAESIKVENETYPVTVKWQLSALKNNLNYASLFLNENFDPKLAFGKANIPTMLNWSNPFSNPSKVDAGWAVTVFSAQNLQNDNCIDIYDETNRAAFALKFLDLPDSGNVGALANGNIDAIRWQYDFFKIAANYSVSFSYQMLTFSMTSYPQLKDPREMNTMFETKIAEPFVVQCRNFASIIRDNNIGFVVYDVNYFDPKILGSGWVQLVYSNNEYVVLKIKSVHPYPNVLESS
jgi:hypothetical protein